MNYTYLFDNAVRASREIALLSAETTARVLCNVAARIEEQTETLLAANADDLSRMDPSNPLYDRLLLSPERIAAIAADMRNVASLPSPVGETISETTRPNGLTIRKIRVPFGVVGVIYEARPNVTFDVFGLCFRSANACVLKGGSDARCTNEAAAALIRSTLAEEGITPDALTLLPSDREATAALLNATGSIDVLIPRGSSRLIAYVRENARVPMIETGAGICHTYFDIEGDVAKGAAIVFNAKTRRVSVCNALDSLVIHAGRLDDLATICAPLASKNVTIYADPAAFDRLQGNYPARLLQPADEESFGTEFLDYKMSVKTVANIDEAIAHVSRYSSRHSEAILTENPETAAYYTRRIDAACVYTNASTAFTDGAQFGFGAEIGISTQKLHARGPMALPELTTYKYVITGDGQTRP